MAKASRTAEVWRGRVLAQRASGQSVRGWCRANNCPEHGFYWWRANLGLSPVSARKRPRVRKSASVGFARVVVEPPAPAVSDPATAAEPLRLTLAGGRELTLPAAMPVEHVARLVRAIEAAGQGAA
ncbi:MAG: hypothetical protein M3Q52_08745 [Pseudomonadota bacterium]|nr:hypothetical protein [Pseudomonadota bacterium]